MNAQTEFDVIVLGVGTCGEDLSLQLLDGGLEVAGVEANLVGGECPYWACLPSKRMIRMGNLVAETHRADGAAGDAAMTPRWRLVAEQVDHEVTGGWQDTTGAARYAERGGRLVRGRGRLAGPRTVVMGKETLTARRGIVLATGSQPMIPPIPGLADVGYWTTHDVIRATELPASLIVLGGGAVGCELGQVLARFGVAVTIVEAADRLLAAEEPEAAAVVTVALAADGVAIKAGQPATWITSDDTEIRVTLGDGETVGAERLLVATGRRTDLTQLGLETVGLDPTARFIDVDQRMRAASGLWAIGDVTGKAMFTHVALGQAAVVAGDLLGRPRPGLRYDAIPRVTFTDPELGAVGLTEERARASGLDVSVAVKQLGSTFRGWLHRDGGGGVVKLVIDRTSGALVGATSVGPSGGEMLGMLSLAVHARVPLADLRSMIYAFPTFHGAVGEMVGAYGRGVTTVLDPGYRGWSVFDDVG